MAGAGGMLLIVWLSIEVRMGMGWLGALRGTSKILSTFAPVTMIGLVVSEVLGAFGLHVSSGFIVNVFRATGLLAASWVTWALLSNCRRIGTELALGLTLVVATMLGPVMWPWYLPPAIVVVVAAGAERFRPAFTVACIGASFFVLPTSAMAHLGSSNVESLVRIGLFVAIAAAALAAQWLAGEHMLPPAVEQWLLRHRRAPEPDALVAA
jgi:hypothetical protein